MRSLILGVVLSVVAAGCSIGAHWVGDGVEAVDGFWIMNERACDDPGCLAAREAALVAMGDPEDKTVTAVAQADWTQGYDTGIGGRAILPTTSGPVGITFFVVLLDLDDGTRVVVPIVCTQQAGAAPGELWDHCGQDPNEHRYNSVGHEPWTQPQPDQVNSWASRSISSPS